MALLALPAVAASPLPSATALPTITIAAPAASGAASCRLQFATQDVFPGVFAGIATPPGEPSPSERLAQLRPAYWRVNSNTDGGLQGLSLPFPDAYTSADGHHVPAWDFSHQAALLAEAPPSVPKLLSVSTPPDVMFTGSGPLGPSRQPGTLRDSTYGALARYLADLVKYYNTGVLVSGAGAAITYTAHTLVDAQHDLTPYGNGSYSVTVDTVAADGRVSWQTAVITGVASAHTASVAGWPHGTPPSGSSYNLASTTPPITSPVPARPWPRPPHAGPVRYWEIMNEPDLSNAFFPRSSPAILPPTPRLTGVAVPGGSLVANRTYAYRLTGMNIAGVESAGGTEAAVSLASGQNAVSLSWSPSSNLGLAPYAYRIYGRSAGAEGALVVVGRDAPGGLTWTDLGSVSPQGGVPTADGAPTALQLLKTKVRQILRRSAAAPLGTAGYQLFRANEYRRMWDAVVPAMKAVDPSIKVVGPAVSAPRSLAAPDVDTTVVTTGPKDTSYIDRRDFVQVLAADSANPPDIISVHAYGGSNGSGDSDAALFAQPDSVTLRQYGQNVQPYAQKIPVWVTETNADGNYLDAGDFRGVTQFDSAWLAHEFVRMCEAAPQVQALFQFEYSYNGTWAAVAHGGPPANCPPEPACDIAGGRPLLSYWTMRLLNSLVPMNSKVLPISASPEGFDVLAVAVPPDYRKVVVVVVNHQAGQSLGLGAPGSLRLQLSGAPADVREWTVDQHTDLSRGPTAQHLGRLSTVPLALQGYAVSVVELDNQDP